MTKLKLSKLIMDYGDFRVEANTSDKLRDYETELVDRLYEAINHNQCCKNDSELLVCEDCKKPITKRDFSTRLCNYCKGHQY